MPRQDESIQATARLIAQECIAGRLRMLTRAVTKMYNQALRPHGLTVSQMNILVAVSYLGQVKQQDVCDALYLEKSTLSRDLARMRAQGWITAVPGDDRRATMLSVTAAGQQLLETAFPAWRQAQEAAKALLGEAEATAIGRITQAMRGCGASDRT